MSSASLRPIANSKPPTPPGTYAPRYAVPGGGVSSPTGVGVGSGGWPPDDGVDAAPSPQAASSAHNDPIASARESNLVDIHSLHVRIVRECRERRQPAGADAPVLILRRTHRVEDRVVVDVGLYLRQLRLEL